MKQRLHSHLSLVLLAAPLLASGCDVFGSENDNFLLEQLNRAEDIWDSTGAATYTLLATRRCDCGIDPRQVRLDVVSDEIVSGTYTDLEEPVDPAVLGQYATVNELFDLARDAVQQRVPVVLIEYNQEFGYIDDLVINYDRTRLDDDVLYRVDGYTTEPVP